VTDLTEGQDSYLHLHQYLAHKYSSVFNSGFPKMQLIL